MKLPPSVKHLLTLRNPSPILNPPPDQLRRAFNATLGPAQKHGAARGWLVLSTAAILGCNSPASIGHLYRYAASSEFTSGLQDNVAKAAVMRESALKGSVFVGVAMAINAMAALMEAVEPEVKERLRKTTARGIKPDNVDSIRSQGDALWNSIYEPHADKLKRKLGSYHPDFPLFILQAYGMVLSPLSDEEVGNVNRTGTSLVGIGTLRAMGGLGPQLVSHVYGLAKAQGGAETEGDRWLSEGDGVAWALESVDKICDAIRGAATKL